MDTRSSPNNTPAPAEMRAAAAEEENALLRAALRDLGMQLAQVTAQRDSLATSAGAAHQRFAQLEGVARFAARAGDVAVVRKYLALLDGATAQRAPEVV